MPVGRDPTADAGPPYLMEGPEVLLGFVAGSRPVVRGHLGAARPIHPRAALAASLTNLVQNGPCLVSFSGGRDSSAILALAADIARRRGLPLPVPFTLRYPAAPEANESAWQELVVRHLRLDDWEVIDVPPESAELLGRVGTASLAAHGLMWPPAVHLDNTWLSHARGSTVITGDGGDDMFGPRRATPLRSLVHLVHRYPSRLDRSVLRGAVKEALPVRARAQLAYIKMKTATDYPWLRSPFREEGLRLVARWTTSEPFSWPKAIRSHAAQPSLLRGLANRDWLAGHYGVRLAHPFLDPQFVEAWASSGWPLGYAGRTQAMSHLFGDLLPGEVLARSTKAIFNGAFNGWSTRAFAQQWDGAGVDTSMVDIEQLRAAWLAERVPARTNALLQAAWLASGQPVLY